MMIYQLSQFKWIVDVPGQQFILVMSRLTFGVVDENAILRLLSVSAIIQFLSTRITKIDPIDRFAQNEHFFEPKHIHGVEWLLIENIQWSKKHCLYRFAVIYPIYYECLYD